MISSKKVLSFALASFITFAAACGSDKATGSNNSGDTLTTAEFDSMVEALDAVGSFSFFGGFGGRGTSTGLAAQQSQSVPYDETETCPGGGTLRTHGNLSFSLSNNNTNYTYDGTLTQTFSSCKGTSSNGTVFTFSGGPTLTFHATYSGTTYNLTMHETGTINWATGGRNGGCSADITITISTNSSGTVATGSYTGTMCGHNVNETF
ncbi:MAG TPA: hypothetical protein VE967_03495 [Gemmatimonadaceae bacterium]|nr:hypothetical protein [Gemmatimonadaceae bacterium]